MVHGGIGKSSEQEDQDGQPKIKSLHELVAADLIERLNKGTAPWQKPWNDSSSAFEFPYNAITGKRYKGINIFSLLSADRADPDG